jgi:hypothetical protein
VALLPACGAAVVTSAAWVVSCTLDAMVSVTRCAPDDAAPPPRVSDAPLVDAPPADDPPPAELPPDDDPAAPAVVSTVLVAAPPVVSTVLVAAPVVVSTVLVTAVVVSVTVFVTRVVISVIGFAASRWVASSRERNAPDAVMMSGSTRPSADPHRAGFASGHLSLPMCLLICSTYPCDDLDTVRMDASLYVLGNIYIEG